MAVERKQVGPAETYLRHEITVHELQPDVLLRVNGQDLGFYTNAEAARRAGREYVDRKVEREG